ncbi:MAG: sensor histidine kinase, partial [Sphingobacteriales bacterium]
KASMQVKRMTSMINGFLNISRLEAGKIYIEKQPFEIRDLLQEILDETKLIVSSHVVNISDCEPVSVNADRDKISSVVSNLVSNAIKYSPQGKLINVGCQLSGDKIIVSVKDEGMGISPQDLGKIFDRYYRVEANQTRHISGFGIGLYLSAEIIKRHYGEIWAESERGKGSTFYFSLPIAG